jgi:hypothetical protein
MEQLGSHWMDFHEFFYLKIWRGGIVQPIEVSLKSDKNNEYFPRRPTHIYDNISINSS